MVLKNLDTESLGTVRAPMPVTVSFRRRILNEVVRLRFCAVSGGRVSWTLLTLAVLIIFTAVQSGPTPTPTPTPLPF